MTQIAGLTIIFCITTSVAFSQDDTSANNIPSDIFDRIAEGVKKFQLNTTTAPDDKSRKKIIELRNLRGGFNLNDAVDVKIEEDRQKNEIPKAELEKFTHYFKIGDGKRWLDNATIWIYRRHFTYNDLRKLVKFYKTPAGQKWLLTFLSS
jgi:hypothetical protein